MIFGDAEPSDSRDDAIFGEAETSSAAEPQDRDSRVLEGGTNVIDRLEAAVEAADDVLTVGGTLWLWAQWNGNRDDVVKDYPLSSPSFLDVYLDARPSDRVRAYARFRTSYDFTVAPGDVDFTGQPIDDLDFALDQLWVKFDIYRQVFVTAGKEPIRWGSGRIWNPTDYLNAAVLDSLAFFDRRLGVPMLKLHYPVESLGWNFYAIALLDGASSIDEIGGAARAEFVFWKSELALSAVIKKDQPHRFGVDLNTALWWFDIKAELALRYDDDRPFYRGRFLLNPRDATDVLEAPVAVDRSNELVPQLVLGAEIQIPYSDRDNLIVSAEYFFNDAGYADTSLYLVPIGAAFGVPGFEGGVAQGFNPLYLGRHYAALSIVAIGPGDWDDTTILLNAVASLSDETVIARVNYSVLLLTFLRLNAFVAVTPGPRGGAFAFGLDIPPVPGVLDGGFSIPPPLFQLGASLNISI